MRQLKRNRRQRATHDAISRVMFEALEPRTLLSAALMGDALNYPLGNFNDTGLSINGGAGISNANYSNQLHLTDGGANELRSAFTTHKFGVSAFSTNFNFQMNSAGTSGIAMVIEGSSATALGSGADGAGGIPASVALSFRNTPTTSQTLLTINGVSSPITDLGAGGIQFGSGDMINVTVEYDGSSLLVNETDTITLTNLSQQYNGVNIAAVTGGTAYLGFTAADGSPGDSQDLLSWEFSNGAPAQTKIGGAAGANSFSYHVAGNYSVSGAGTGFGSTADQLSFVSQSILGDSQMIARVTVPAGGSQTKAGLMLRDTLDASSAFAWVGVTSGGVQFVSRSAAGGASASSATIGEAAGSALYIKLVGNGPMVSGYVSATGADGNWTLVGTAPVAAVANLSLGGALMGMAVSSGSSGTSATVSFTSVSRIEVAPIGVDTGSAGASPASQEQLWVNVIKQSSGFSSLNDANTPATVDANGWPTTDFQMPDIIQEFADAGGVYHLSMHVSQNPTITIGGGTLANQTYNAGTGTLNADITVGTSGSLSMSVANTGGGATNIQLIRPGYNPLNPPVFTTNYLNFMQSLHPRILRFMNWLSTNDNPVQTWAQRALPSDPTQTGMLPLLSFNGSNNGRSFKGIAWEYAIMLANDLHTDMWINIPAEADDNYIQQLASLIKNGDTVNGVNYAGLNPDLNVYIEYSNEAWNAGFAVFQYSNSAAIHEVASQAGTANPSNLNYDNLPLTQKSDGSYVNGAIWQQRWTARRLLQVANSFGSVFGSGSINTRIRPVLSNIPVPSIQADQLAFVNAVYGAPKNFIYSIASVVYANDLGPFNSVNTVNGGNASPNLTKSDVLYNLYTNGNALYSFYAQMLAVTSPYGLQINVYESGSDLSGIQGTGAGGAKEQAELSPQYETFLQNYYDVWFGQGGGAAIYYTSGVRAWGQSHGDFQITDSTLNLNNTKEIALRQVIENPRAGVVPGIPTGLKPIAQTSSEVDLVWDSPITGAVEYRVEASNTSDFSGNVVQQIAPAGSSSWNFTGLMPGVHYSFRVSADSYAGDSAFSGSTGGTTLGALALPAAPSNVTATAVSSSTAQVQWVDHAQSETGFSIDLATDALFTQNVQNFTTGADVTQLMILDLNGSTNYYFRARAVNGAGSSAAAVIAAPLMTPAPMPLVKYVFAEGSGALALDTSGVGDPDTGTIHGGATRGSGPNGLADVNLDGSTGNITINAPPRLDISGQITVSAWIKSTSVPHSEDIIAKNWDGINGPYYLSLLDASTIDFGTFRSDYGNLDAIGHTAAPITDGQWHLLAGVYDGKEFKVFLDGHLLGIKIDSFGVAGSNQTTVIGGNDNHFLGGIADVQIFNNGLSNSDIAGLWGQPVVNVPIAQVDSYVTTQNIALNPAAGSGVLANDLELTNHTMTAVLVSGVSHGALTLNSDGSFLYTPTTNFVGNDSFVYTATDANGSSVPTTVSLTVSPTPVTNFVVSTVASDHVVLKWDDNPIGLIGVNIQESTDGFDFSTIDQLPPTAKTDTVTGLTPGTQYFFRIYTASVVGNSDVVGVPPIITPALNGASKLVFAQAAGNVAAHANLGSVVINVEDSQGNVVSTDNSSVTIGLSGLGSLGGTLTVTAVNGVATFNDLFLNAAGTYMLSAMDGILASATSAGFTVSPAAASQLVYTQQPVSAVVGAAASPAFVVNVEDAYGNIVTSDQSNVTLGVASGPGGGTLSGTLTAAANDGVATFSNVILSVAGGYTINATDGALQAGVSGMVSVVPRTFATLTGGVLTVISTSNPANIEVSESGGMYTVTENGVASTPFLASSVSQMFLSGSAGNDTITVDANIVLGAH
ncbi:MAG: fibronectin type III domain-containing protein, partial [Planctomycetota bacterium]|nr:fibronectin type III domain-containing protein [Planctomycetota bacterium]